MGKLLHFGNVAPFSLDTTHIITPDDKLCKHGTCHGKTYLITYANNKGADQPAQSELSDQYLYCSLSTPYARSFRRRFFAYHYAANHPHTNIIIS